MLMPGGPNWMSAPGTLPTSEATNRSMAPDSLSSCRSSTVSPGAKKLRIAESELRGAEDEMAHSRDSVIRDVWKARTDFETSLRKQESAAKLVAAAESAFAASFEAYQHGLGTYVDVVNAQRNLTASRSVIVDTRSAIFTSQTALALSIGDLAKPSPAARTIHQP